MTDESDFELSERIGAQFLSRVSSTLERALAEFSSQASVAEARNALEKETQQAIAAMPAATDQRQQREVQNLFIDFYQQHLRLLANPEASEDSALYRRLVEALSVHTQRASIDERSADAVLSFELTADQPSMDELDSEDREVARQLSLIRGDLRVALLVHDTDVVMRLTELELVHIAQKREAHGVLEYDNPPPVAYGSLLIANQDRVLTELLNVDEELAPAKDIEPLDFAARSRILRGIYADQRQRGNGVSTPIAIAAAHVQQSGQLAGAAMAALPRDRVLPQRVLTLQPLIEWNSLSNAALAQISAIINNDTEARQRAAALDALYSEPRAAALASSAALYDGSTLPMVTYDEALRDWMRGRRDEASLDVVQAALGALALQEESTRLATSGKLDERLLLDYVEPMYKKVAVVLRTVEFLAQLVFLSSMAGTLTVRSAAVYEYEDAAWHEIKQQLVAIGVALERQLAGLALERLMRALAGEVGALYTDDAERAAAAYRQIGTGVLGLLHSTVDVHIVSLKFSELARSLLAAALPDMSAERVQFHAALIESTAASLDTISHFFGRTAALFATAGVLARGITFDAAGKRRGINVLEFADTLHASFDVAAHAAFQVGFPVLRAQSKLLTLHLAAEERHSSE